MAVTTRGSILAELRPGLKKVFGDYETHPAQWKEFLTETTSDKSEEWYSQVRLLGFSAVKPEGMPGKTDKGFQDRFTIRIINQTVQNSFLITREAIEDNLYDSQFPQGLKALKKSLIATKDLFAAMMLVSNQTIYDGQPLFSNAHPTDVGTLSNLIVGDPTTAVIDQAQQNLAKWTDQAGIPSLARFKKAIISPKHLFNMSQICGSEFAPENGNNAINPTRREGIIPQGYTINNYLGFASAAGVSFWCLTTDCDGWVMQTRKKVYVDSRMDENSGVLRTIGGERYAAGIYDWRGGAGVAVA